MASVSPVLSYLLVLLTGVTAGAAVGFLFGATAARRLWKRRSAGRSVITGADLAVLTRELRTVREVVHAADLLEGAGALRALTRVVDRLEGMPLAGTVPSSWDNRWEGSFARDLGV